MKAEDRDIRLRGDLIDRPLLSRVLDAVTGEGARYELLSLDLGQSREAKSEAVIRIVAEDSGLLDRAVRAALRLGAEELHRRPAELVPAPADGVLPECFYATSNLPTEVLVDGHWLRPPEEEMDLALVVDPDRRSVRSVAMAEVRAGELVVVGEQGVRVRRLPPAGEGEGFRFMASEVSAEKPKNLLIRQVVRILRRIKEKGEKLLFVGGPAIVHTGAGKTLERLVEAGWVDVLFAGNALAAHDIEQALFGTSLGVPVAGAEASASGHAHHLWAINAVRRCGSIAAAVESGVLTRGIMHACVVRRIPYLLAGSIRDDGPLPDVVTDAVAAQSAMRRMLPGVGMAIMVGTTLHAVATGNLLPARVFTVCVDLNPGAVTKLRDRGSRQSVGIVMDAASFLEQLLAGVEASGGLPGEGNPT